MEKSGWIILALVLIALGVGSFLLEGVTWVTQETVIDAGPLQVTAEQEERLGLPAWVSLVLTCAGLAALALGFTKSGQA